LFLDPDCDSAEVVIVPKDMKKLLFFVALIIAFFMVFAERIPESKAIERSLQKGEITGIDLDQRTFVIEVLLNEDLYTVGGVVSTDAVLKKGGLKTGLESFRIGDTVRVGWRKDKSGHKIQYLEAVNEPPSRRQEQILWDVLWGTPQSHIIQDKETLLDIARQYNLGFNEIEDLYPYLDPWIPPAGMELIIPTQRILPDLKAGSIVINIAEMRLYYLPDGDSGIGIMTYPVGLGDKDWTTPLGRFKIGEKRTNPAWHIPPSLQYKYPVKVIPPGPDNPLGKYWMRLEGTDYGIHGTDIPWAIGRLVTHGCIRLYPEDIIRLFKLVKPGTEVRIIYEPVKIGLVSGRVYAEVHRDIYDRIEDLAAYGQKRLREDGLLESVDPSKFRQALELQDGMLRDITLNPGE